MFSSDTLNKKSHEQFLIEVRKALLGDEYIVLSKYENVKKEVTMKHNQCGTVFDITPDSFLHAKRRCPKCYGKSKSLGTLFIIKILKEKNLKFEQEFKFPDCKYKLPLQFDLAIFNHENNVAGLIEYDGPHHFQPINSFGGYERYQITTVRNDEIKNNYCKNKKIPLLRVPYNYPCNIVKEIVNLFIKEIMGVS
jgi:hypothetical protein